MSRRTDLVSCLPPFMAEFQELSAALEAENPEFDLAWDSGGRALANRFLEDMDSCGLSRWERILGLHPRTEDSLETRRAGIRAVWMKKPPYTLRWLKGWLDGVCGREGYPLRAEIEVSEYDIRLRFWYSPGERGRDRSFELTEDVAGLAPVNMLLLPASIYEPVRFIWTPDVFRFRRFSVLGTMSSHRFDGELLKAVLGAYRFSHYQGGVRFGGEVDFDGEIPFGQTYGHIPFPRLTVRGKLRSQLPEEVSVCLGIGAGAFRNHEGLDFPRLLWRAFRFNHYQGTARFDGSAGFDGEIPFNQVRGKIPFPRLTIHGELRSQAPGRLSAFWRPGTFPFRHALRAELPRLAWGGFRFSRCRGTATASVTFSCGFSKVESRFSMAGFSGTSPIREQNRLVFGAVSVSGTAVRHIEGLSGTLTMDNWRTLDGDMLLDGAYQLDAYLREEKL